MAYPISDVARRIIYSGSAGVGPYSFAFEVLEQTDVAVYKNTTLLTLTTDYTVTINVDGTGSITLVSPAVAADDITLIGARAIERTSDFVTGGDLFANTLNDELDSQTIFAQQQQDEINRSMKMAPWTNTAFNTQLPDPLPNYFLGFNATADGFQSITGSELAGLIAYANAFADTFVGDGSTTSWTLTRTPANLLNLDVSIDGVTQVPTTDYTISGTTFTMTSAPPANSVILVRYAELLADSNGDSVNVRYTPAGTGAVDTTVQAKLRETVSVKDFGAVGDGVTDDTSAIRTAILASSGKSLYFPSGSYLITSTITFANVSNMTLFGEPFASKIVVNTSFNLWSIGATCSNIEISGLEFDGASTTNDGFKAITTFAPKTVLQNCYIHNWTSGFANSNEDANDCKVINNYFKDIGSSGAGSGSGYAVYGIGLRLIVTGNTFDNVARHDVYLSGSSPQGSQYCVIANNTSVNCGVESIALYNVASYDGVRYCTVANNTIKNNLGSRAIGLDVNTCDNVVIGNTIVTPAQYGIFLEGGEPANSYPNRNTITGNVIIDPGTLHIFCVNGSDNIFTGNVLSSVSVTPTNQSGIIVTYSGTPTTYPTGNVVSINKYSGITGQGSIAQLPSGVFAGINVIADQVSWLTMANGATAPSVKNAKHIVFDNSGATSITNLTDGYEGQEVTMYFTNGNTTITLANFYLQGFTSFVGSQWDTLTVIKKSTGWFEKCRSVN